MRIFCLALLLLLASVSFASGEQPAIHTHDHSDCCPADEKLTPASLNELSAKPYRPKWAPLPIFHGATFPTPSLHKHLSSGDTITRARSAFLLGQIGAEDSIEPLAKLMEDPMRDVRVHAGIALANLGDERGVPVCAAVLGNDPVWVRYYAVYGLWRIGTPRAIQILENRLEGEDEFISKIIKEALDTPNSKLRSFSLKDTDSSDLSIDEIRDSAADVFVVEADWWWHLGDFPQAIRCLEAELFLMPKNVQSYSLIAWLQWSMGDDAIAIRSLNRGISADTSSHLAHFNLGFHYMNTQRYALAEGYLEKALDLGGGHIMRRQYAHCLERLGKIQECFEQWEILFEQEPDDPAVQYNHGRVKKLVEDSKSSQG